MEKAGYPRFKGKARFDSVLVWPKDGDGARWLLDQRRVYLQGIGQVKVTVHRPVLGRVKTRLGILVQLHDVICPTRARRYDLDDEHDIRRRGPGQGAVRTRDLESTTMSGSRTLGGNDTLVVTSISGTASSPSGR